MLQTRQDSPPFRRPLDARGNSSVQAANAGNVECLCRVQTPDGGLLIACGENNDFDRAFVAAFEEDDPPWRSPLGDRPRYQYQRTFVFFFVFTGFPISPNAACRCASGHFC